MLPEWVTKISPEQHYKLAMAERKYEQTKMLENFMRTNVLRKG